MKTYKGWNAVVFGATGGIGSAIAERLAHEGFFVVLTARTEKNLKLLQDVIGDASAAYRRCDPSSMEHVADLAASIDQLLRGKAIDVVVNAAGSPWKAVTLDTDTASAAPTLEEMYEGHMKTAYNIIHVFGKRLRRQERGIIITISSHVASDDSLLGNIAYGSAKAFVSMCSRNADHELESSGSKVRACVIEPGTVNTDSLSLTAEQREKSIQPADIAAAVISLIEKPERVRFMGESGGRF